LGFHRQMGERIAFKGKGQFSERVGVFRKEDGGVGGANRKGGGKEDGARDLLKNFQGPEEAGRLLSTREEPENKKKE